MGKFTPDTPDLPPPVAVPRRQDPEIDAARDRQREAEKRRKGRRAANITGGIDDEEQLGVVSRPQARAAQNLGG